MEADFRARLETFVGRMMGELDENQRTIFHGGLSYVVGHGGITWLSQLTGISRVTITKGRDESLLLICDPKAPAKENSSSTTQKEDTTRKSVELKFPGITEAMEKTLLQKESGSAGDPLSWTVQSVKKLREELPNGSSLSEGTVCNVLKRLGFTLAPSRRQGEKQITAQTASKQFAYINKEAKESLKDSIPVLFVNVTKRTIANRVTGEYWPTSRFLSNGIREETLAYTATMIQQWWREVGRMHYPGASKILIAGNFWDGDEKNITAWQQALQRFASAEKLTLHVCHFPWGTTRWNNIDHYLTLGVANQEYGDFTISWEISVTHIGQKGKPLALQKASEQGQDEATGTIIPDSWRGDWNFIVCPDKKNLS